MKTKIKYWVIVKFNDGTVKVWRDYGATWGSPSYTVLGYFAGSYREAMKKWGAKKDFSLFS